MKNKICVIDETKVCNNCGECSTCLLDPKKECDNCGDCVKPRFLGERKITIDKIEDAFVSEANLNNANKDSEKENIFEHFMLHDVKDENYINDDQEFTDKLFSQIDQDKLDKAIKDFKAADLSDEEIEEEVEYIEDIDGLSELINDKENHGKCIVEEFPGLLKFDKDYKKHKNNKNK